MVELEGMQRQSKFSAAVIMIGFCLGAAGLTGCTKLFDGDTSKNIQADDNLFSSNDAESSFLETALKQLNSITAEQLCSSETAELEVWKGTFESVLDQFKALQEQHETLKKENAKVKAACPWAALVV